MSSRIFLSTFRSSRLLARLGRSPEAQLERSTNSAGMQPTPRASTAPWGSASASSEARDAEFMRRAIQLAREGWGRTAPNPLVGAVVVRDGAVVGEGSHEEFGGPHAEINALAEAGDRARGATLYVTLEPCDHQGKTPPCSRAILTAGIRRVVIAVEDPTPLARGGASFLRENGVDVDIGVGAQEAAE